MRKQVFLKAIETYKEQIVKLLATKTDKDEVQDALHNMVEHHLEKKQYVRIPHETIDNKMKGYLMQATQWEIGKLLRKKNSEGHFVFHLVEEETEEESSHTISCLKEELDLKNLLECPFCHIGVLNQYGACALCHTILGTEHGTRKSYTLEKMVESICPDLSMFADVNIAMSKLSDIEQKVVQHIVQGNESLENLAELMRIPRTQLWRIWTHAKSALQQELFEYSYVNA